MVFDGDSGDEAVVLLEAGRAHPLEHGVNWISGAERQVNKARRHREQNDQNEFEGEPDHFEMSACRFHQ